MVRTLAVAAALAATSSALPHTLSSRWENPPVPEGGDKPPKLYTVELAPGDVRKVTEEGKFQLTQDGKEYIDITNHPNLSSGTKTNAVKAVAYPSELAFTAEVEALIPEISADNIESTLTTFTEFYTHYYRSEDGIASAEWVLEQVNGVLSGVATAEAYQHADFDQISVIATIPGKSEKKVIVGGHLDTIGTLPNGRSPGADDNGSGSMSNLEALRVLLSDPAIANGEAENTIEFHWYAGEEAGLLGSADIFDEYASEGAEVLGMLQQDMTGYVSSTGAMGVVTDYVDASLVEFMKIVIDAYTTIGYVETECGYGCSDHASATAAGFPASFIFESAFEDSNPDIHSARDTMDNVSIEHVVEFTAMAVGYVYELAFTAGL